MKIKFIHVVCVTLFLNNSFVLAQSSGRPFLGVSAGLSTPLGSFSQTDLGSYNNWNNKTGFAKTGFNIGLEGVYYLHPNIAIGGVLNYADHGKLNSSDAKKLGDSYTDAFAVDYTIVTTSKRYKTLNFLAGPYFSLPYKKWTLDIRWLGGLTQSLSTPEISVQLEGDQRNVFTQKSSTASAFGWQAGLGLRYAWTEKIGLSIRSDYFTTNGIKISNENRNNTSGRLVSNQQMSWINVSVGLTLALGQ